MKVLFLDFDGVLNSERYCRFHPELEGAVFDPVCMLRLRRIVEATGAKIVLSTSWREHWSPEDSECDNTGLEINQAFAEQGLSVYGKTGVYRIGEFRRNPDVERVHEILDWLSEHPDVERYVVLDDRDLTASGLPEGHMVKTSGRVGGLTDADADTATCLLTE